ncbi:hypothetical protein AB0N05_25795 [Nocardia sp. NPDC051030]|uniref:phthiocerol/phthiodiolone dimycocerosyl transferase family protein n=1 Tax=Nocardia sp. NPDC051030 TaxID=3155162 RepID=UPI00343B6878
MKYELGTIDHGFVPRKLTVDYATMCTGDIDTELLRQAFEMLCRKYPMLGGTIEIDGGRGYLHTPDTGSGAASVEIIDSTIADWLARTEPLDPAASVARLEIVLDDGVTAVALRVAHAINDAQMGFALLEDFWHMAAALSGTAAVLDPTPVHPRRLEELYLERGLPLPELSGSAPGPVYSVPSSEVPGESMFRLSPGDRITLSASDTRALLGNARAWGTTIHALVSAAIIRAERAMIAESADSATELPMIMYHLVDLRPHLDPPARPSDATNALGFAPTITPCGSGSDLQVLAKETKEQIVRGIDTGSALAVMRAAATLAAERRTRNSTGNFLTNWGVVPDLECPQGMQITGFRGFATSEPVSWVGYFVYTFRGELTVELEYSDRFHRPEQITDLHGILTANLKQLSRSTR